MGGGSPRHDKMGEEQKLGGAGFLSKAAQLAMAPVRRFNPDWDIGLHKELLSQKSSSIDSESVNSKPVTVSIKQPMVKFVEPQKSIKVEVSPFPSSTPS